MKFVLVGGEITGAWGPRAKKVIRFGPQTRTEHELGEELVVISKGLWRRLSRAVAKGVTRSQLRGFPGATLHDR